MSFATVTLKVHPGFEQTGLCIASSHSWSKHRSDMKTGVSFNLLQSWQVCVDLLSLWVCPVKDEDPAQTLGLSVLPWKQHNHHRLGSFCSPFLESRTCLPAFSNFQADLFSDHIWVLSSLPGFGLHSSAKQVIPACQLHSMFSREEQRMEF